MRDQSLFSAEFALTVINVNDRSNLMIVCHFPVKGTKVTEE